MLAGELQSDVAIARRTREGWPEAELLDGVARVHEPRARLDLVQELDALTVHTDVEGALHSGHRQMALQLAALVRAQAVLHSLHSLRRRELQKAAENEELQGVRE